MIGDSKYRNGIPWIEIQQFIISYVFETLGFNRLGYSCLSGHSSSMAIGPVMFFKQEGLKKQAILKNGKYYDIAEFALLRSEYFEHKDSGDYEFMSILSRYANYAKKEKK